MKSVKATMHATRLIWPPPPTDSLHSHRGEVAHRRYGQLLKKLPFDSCVGDVESVLLCVLLRLASREGAHHRKGATSLLCVSEPSGEQGVLCTLIAGFRD